MGEVKNIRCMDVKHSSLIQASVERVMNLRERENF
jgi:hypothetical protein